MSGMQAYFPSALPQINPGMNSYPFATPQSNDSYMSQFFPNAPSQPKNVIRDPLMGSTISLGTLSDCPDVLTLPDVLVFSTVSKVDSYLFTVVLPIQNMKHITTFRYSVTDYPQMPIEQVSELGVPRYLHHRKWTTTTSLTRWAIGNRYSMEYLKHAKGEQQQLADKMQIAVSFAALLDMIVLNGLKTAHHQLRSKLEEFGTYQYTDVCNALEFHKTHFAALQKRENGWSLYLRKVITKMGVYGGSATALIVDKTISAFFANRPELIEYSRSGAVAAPRVNNPEMLMAENTPVDKILYTDFKPAAVGALLSPMQHIVQIGNWFVSQDLPIFTSQADYPKVYSTACREPQIYDQELDSFVTLKLEDLIKRSDIFKPDGRFNKAIFKGSGDGENAGSDFIGDLFGNNGGESKGSARLLIESFIYKICSFGNMQRSELDYRLEHGLRVYEKMASQDFDREHLNNLIRWSCITGQATAQEVRTSPKLKHGVDSQHVSTTTFANMLGILVDKDTSSLKMNRANGREHALPTFKTIKNESVARAKPFGIHKIHHQPPSTFCGHLSWDGFVQIHAYYESLPSNDKASAEADWAHVYNFVEAIKLIVQYWRRNLVSCGLFDSVKGTKASLQKTPEESLVDQVFNFNATFALWTNYHKLSLFFTKANIDPTYYKGVQKRSIRETSVAGTGPWSNLGVDNATNEAYLATIYDRLVAETFADMLDTIEKTETCRNDPALFANIKNMLKIPISGGLLTSLPDMLTATWTNISKRYRVVETLDLLNTNLANVCNPYQLAGALKENAPVLSRIHWALIGEWVLRMYEIGLYAIGQALYQDVVDKRKIANFIVAFNTLFAPHPRTIIATDMTDLNNVTVNNDYAGNYVQYIAAAKPIYDTAYATDGGDATAKKAAGELAVTTAINAGTIPGAVNFSTDGTSLVKLFTFDYADIVPDPALMMELQKLWFIPGPQNADDLIKDKESSLTAMISTLLPEGKKWDDKDTSYALKLPNAADILAGDIPLLRNTRFTQDQIFGANAPDAPTLNTDLVGTFDGTYTTKLAKLLGVTRSDNEPGHDGPVTFYGQRERETMYDLNGGSPKPLDPDAAPPAKRKFDENSSLWVQTPFRLSYEQVVSLYSTPVNGVSELDFRVSDPTERDYPNVVGMNNKMKNGKKPFANLIKNFEQLQIFGNNVEKTDSFDSDMLPFMNSRVKCRDVIDGSPYTQTSRKHVGDNLFGYRLNLGIEELNRLNEKIVTHVKHDRSPLTTVICMLVFTTRFNQHNSDTMRKQGIVYPFDFIIWRLWANYVANIMFLVNPGIKNLGFVALAAADHRSGQSPMDKTGMFNSSIWAGSIIHKPENTVTLYNAAITSFGHGGGSGYIDKADLEDVDNRNNYRTPAPGQSSASLLVSAIRKGSCPKRQLLSVTGRLPEGDYESSGLQKGKNNDNEKHYETCDYYAAEWGLGKYGNNAKSLAEALGPDGVTTDTNILAYKGTTRYYDPYHKNHNIMTLNTGHFGHDEGPGCKEARMSGIAFPAFHYNKNQLLRLVD